MVSYKFNDPKGFGGDPKRGAALGRKSLLGPYNFSGTLFFREVYVDSQGFDINGTYLGHLGPWWWCASEDQKTDWVFMAKNLEDARRKIYEKWPQSQVAFCLPDEECFEEFFRSYLDTALEYEDGDECNDYCSLSDDYTSDDIDPICLQALRKEAKEIFEAQAIRFDGQYASAGEKFYLLRNEYEVTADQGFYEAARKCGHLNLYVTPAKDHLVYALGYEDDKS